MSKTKVITISNQKGGVGKTTTVANLAYALTQMGNDVLCIDFDSQASLTNYLNVGLEDDKSYFGVYEMMLLSLRKVTRSEYPELAAYNALIETEEGFAKLCEVCIHRPTYLAREVQTIDGKRRVVDVEREFGFDLLPSHLFLADYSLELSRSASSRGGAGALRLYYVVQRIINWHEYDYILIDTNPSLEIMTMNAICAATDGVLVPTNLDLLSTRGVGNLVNKIGEIQELLLHMPEPIIHMGVIGILLNLYSERRKVDTTIQSNLNTFYPFRILQQTIPESVDAKRAVLGGLIYSQVHKKAAAQYLAVAEELEATLALMKQEGQKIQYLESASDLKIADPGE